MIAYGEKNAGINSEVDHDEKSVSLVLAMEGQSKRAGLESSCNALIEILHSVHQITRDESTLDRQTRFGWTAAYKLCRMVSSSAHEDDVAASE